MVTTNLIDGEYANELRARVDRNAQQGSISDARAAELKAKIDLNAQYGKHGAPMRAPAGDVGSPLVQQSDEIAAMVERVVEADDGLTLDDCVFALVCGAIESSKGFLASRLADELEALEDDDANQDPRLSMAILALRLVSDGSVLSGERFLRALKRDPRFAAAAEEAEQLMATEEGRAALREDLEVRGFGGETLVEPVSSDAVVETEGGEGAEASETPEGES